MNSVTLSAIVPVYNVQEYIEECLKSIVNQTVAFDEVILVNDGSTDESQKICELYCQRYKYFKLINQQNQGLSCARNMGIQQAIGEYIVFIDSDDYVRSDMALVIKEKVMKTNLDILFYSASMQYDVFQKKDSDFYVRKEELCNKVMLGKEFFRESFPDNYIVSACLGAYKREFLQKEKIVFPKGIYFEDNVFSLNVFMKANSILCISEKLYIRRIRNESITTSKISLKKCEDILKVQLLQWEIICENEIEAQNINFYRKFIEFGIVQVIDIISEAKENTMTLACEKKFVETFFQCWYSIFTQDKADWCGIGILLFMLKECKKYPDCIKEIFLSNKKYQNIYEEIEKKFYEQLKNLLAIFPLNEMNKKIAIYGIGKHTEKLICFYQEIFGMINCDLYFVVTKGQLNDTYMGKRVVSCDAIDEDTDFVVVSSLIYQDEMLIQLKKRNVKQNKIIILYNNSEIYDLVLAWKIHRQ